MKTLFGKCGFVQKNSGKFLYIEANELLEDIYMGISTKPDFDTPSKTPTNATALDTFAIPADRVSTPEEFQNWFEKRFFLLDERGVQHFTFMCREALEVLLKHEYLLFPQRNCDFAVSKKIERIVRSGFKTKNEIYSFFKKVAVENIPSNAAAFFSPERKSCSGADKLSTCRVLSKAYVLEYIRASDQFREFKKSLGFLFGQVENFCEGSELGILTGLRPNNEKKSIIPNLDMYSPDRVLEWVEDGEILEEGVTMLLDGIPFYIPEFRSGVKGGIRLFLKMIRKPEEEFQIMKDVFRMRFIFKNGTPKAYILDVLHALQEEARGRSDPEVDVQFKEKNYFSEQERESFFPNISKTKGRGARTIVTERGGEKLSKIKVDSNENSGKGYKSLSAILQLKHKGKVFFAFEIQCLTREELDNNEREETPEDRFLYNFRQLEESVSRGNGALTREEMVNSIGLYLASHAVQSKIRKKISGNISGNKRSRRFEVILLPDDTKEDIDFRALADTMFDFFVKEGSICKVPQAFPKKLNAKRNELDKSPFYIHREIKSRITAILDGSFQVKTFGKAEKGL